MPITSRSIKCPNCNSTAVRSREAVYKAGTANYSGRSSSSGLSFGLTRKRNPRLWFGGSSHSGTRQSLKAQDAAPLPVFSVVIIIPILYLFGSDTGGILGLIVSFFWIVYASKHNTENYEKEWVCSKCGYFFDPKKYLVELNQIRSSEIKAEIDKLIPFTISGGTKAQRKKNCQTVIRLIDEFHTNSNSLPTNRFDELRKKMEFRIRIADVLDFLDKADAKHFLKDNKSEIKYLLQALHALISLKVSNKDFNSLQAESVTTGNLWTVKYLKKRLLKAGYNP